jgi:hypothetical protein
MTQQTADEVYAAKMKDLFIETVSGKNFYIDSSPFDIHDIASALSKLCRFNGHTKKFYSVAQHSILVADIMENLKLGDPFEGLLHDATEAYLADIPSPWKVLLPEYKALETRLDKRLRAQFKLPEKITDGAKRADFIALYVEANHLIPTGGSNWPAPEGIKEAALDYEKEFGPPTAFYHAAMGHALFLGRFDMLRDAEPIYT